MGGKDCLHGIKFRLGMKRESNEKMDAFWRIHPFGGDVSGWVSVRNERYSTTSPHNDGDYG